MAERLLKEHLYGDLLSPTPCYATDFAVGMTYSLGFEAMLTAHLAFGMLGDADENMVQSPHAILEAITKNSDKVVVFCNKGGIAVPPNIQKAYSLLENNIFEVFDKANNKANFHPKIWVIREVNKDNSKDILIKLIVTSRNLTYSDTHDCVACITGKVGKSSVKNEHHKPLAEFIKEVAKCSNINDEQLLRVNKLANDIIRIENFDVDEPFEDYAFYPYLFNKDFGNGDIKDYLVGTESIIVSPFIDKTMMETLNPNTKNHRVLITRKEYVDKDIFSQFNEKGGVYVCLDELASRGMDLHAKMYYIWNGRDDQYLFIGSANATSSAFYKNGEFLLGLKYKYSNSHADSFLSEFCDPNSSDSKYIKLNEPIETASCMIKWDEAESAMKDLMCADDLIARVTRHRTGDFSTCVSSTLKKKLDYDVYIAPLHRRDLEQKWNGRINFDFMSIDELSMFYILSATSKEGTKYETVVKIETQGIPSDRDKAIYQSIIKNKHDFFRFLELMLTETPLQFLTNESMIKEMSNGDNNKNEELLYSGIYEKMLKIAACNPHLLREIGKIIKKLGDDVVPEEFNRVYRIFMSVVK